ncbi:MAG TPA: DUF4157 domain-containing protein [Pyrinomonadaceae bacterium]|nr:DUF4157 domain-containing protein [Pyrinomonadaceae bacterium]
MKTFAQKEKRPSSSLDSPNTAAPAPVHRAPSRLDLQRAFGNQAVQRVLQAHPEFKAGSADKTSPRIEHDSNRISLHVPVVGVNQPKLAISKPGDESERAADSVSEQVMRMPDQQLQPDCDSGGGCSKCQVEESGVEHKRLQTKQVGSSDLAQAGTPPIVQEVSRSSGQPLDEGTRGFMESRFGHDFSQVRVRADVQAAEAARMLNARAYTVGSNIVFGAGEYAPGMDEGKRLLAHELTHVVQQSSSTGATVGLAPVTSPIIQRVLIATGDTAGFASLVNSIITTQLQLNVDSTGRVTLDATHVQGPPTREASALTDVLRQIISDTVPTTIAFVHGATSTDPGDQAVMIGSYDLARIDLDDVGAIGSGEGISSGSALAHELVEQRRRQVFAEPYPVAHAAGMAEEEVVTGGQRGTSTRRQIDATTYEIEIPFTYPDHTVWVTRVVQNNNILSVRRRVTRP